jgi:hypothetical protein
MGYSPGAESMGILAAGFESRAGTEVRGLSPGAETTDISSGGLLSGAKSGASEGAVNGGSLNEGVAGGWGPTLWDLTINCNEIFKGIIARFTSDAMARGPSRR